MDATGDLVSSPHAGAGGERAGSPRRLLLLVLVVASAWAATDVFASVLATDRLTYLDVAILGMFFLSFAWISSAFWTALAGFVTIWRGDGGSLTAPEGPLPDDARTAIRGPGWKAAVESTLRTRPAPRAVMAGRNRLDRAATAVTLTAIISRSASGSVSTKGP